MGPEEKAGLDAAKEIHVDVTLHPMEIERTRFLTRQKSKLKEGMGTATKVESGLLIKRNFATGKKAQLAKMREMDADVREFLALDAYFARQELRRKESVASDSNAVASSQLAVKFLLGRSYDTGYRYDIWDVIIDRVAIMSVCRSEESKVLSRALAFDGSSFSKTVIDLSDHTIDGIVQSLVPNSQTAIGTRLNTPVSKRLVPAKSVKSSRGTPAISKNLRSEKGSVSVTGHHKSEVCVALFIVL